MYRHVTAVVEVSAARYRLESTSSRKCPLQRLNLILIPFLVKSFPKARQIHSVNPRWLDGWGELEN